MVVNRGKAAGARLIREVGSLAVAAATAAASAGSVMVAACSFLKVRDTCKGTWVGGRQHGTEEKTAVRRDCCEAGLHVPYCLMQLMVN